jgi:hypothetical protein
MFSKSLYLFVIVLLSIMFVPLYSCTAPAGNEVKLKATVDKLQKATQTGLDKLDADLAAAAVKLKSTGISGDAARQILSGLCAKYPYLIDCSTADTSGKVVAMAPEAYRKYEGANIETQAVKTPVLSPYIKTVEGKMAVSLMRPVFDEKGTQIGIVDALFEPGALLGPITESELGGTEIHLNVLQTDGMTIYDRGNIDKGKNLLTDAEYKPYKELVALGSRFAAEESGTGSYVYPSHTTAAPTKKLAVWSSVKLHGTSWRLVAVQENTN